MPLKEAALQFNKKIKVGFSGGALSSNLGGLLYREFDEKTGFSRLIEERLKIKDPVTHTSHEYEGRGSEKSTSIWRAITSMMKPGKGTGFHHDFWEKPAGFSAAPLPLNQRVDDETVQSLKTINQAYLDRLYALRPSAQRVLDVDSSNFETFGNQEGSSYNAHCQDMGFHPLLLFDGLRATA